MNTGSVSLKHRPFLAPIWLTVLAAFLAFVLLVVAAVAVWKLVTSDPTTVIVVRHAETEAAGGEDPALSAEGVARAALLLRMLGDDVSSGRLKAIYVSRTLRSQATAAPLAAALKLTPIVTAADDPIALARRALREHPGGTVLIVGHAFTVPAIVAHLSGQDIPSISESDHGTMYIVTVPRIGHAGYVRLTY